jgi:hypothetical protein
MHVIAYYSCPVRSRTMYCETMILLHAGAGLSALAIATAEGETVDTDTSVFGMNVTGGLPGSGVDGTVLYRVTSGSFTFVPLVPHIHRTAFGGMIVFAFALLSFLICAALKGQSDMSHSLTDVHSGIDPHNPMRLIAPPCCSCTVHSWLGLSGSACRAYVALACTTAILYTSDLG